MRNPMAVCSYVGLLLFVGAAPLDAKAADLMVVSVSPSRHALAVPVDAAFVVEFDKPVVPASIVSLRTFWAFGRWSGTVTGTFTFSDGDRTVTLTPDRPFSAGEKVMVILSHDIEATDGSRLRAGGYSWQFWTAARPSPMAMAEVQRFSTRTVPTQPTRAYGGIASDLDRDGLLDLTIVNEDTADLRVFMNRADGTGLLHTTFLQPTFAVGPSASPSEPSDFNRDGIVDICVANIGDNSVSILLGVGDGTLGSQQKITVGLTPRGIAVLDADGDGDTDIVNTNSGSNNLSILYNDGFGAFGSPTFFGGGGVGERALAAGDMNGDGVLDLVVGAYGAQQVLIDLGNGDGTFSFHSAQSSGGTTWMLVLGDLDGNGTEDVTLVNSNNARGAVMFGDGEGNLSAPMLQTVDSSPIATDIGDLDGDGDLDWVTSSYSGDWLLFRNNGAGSYSFAKRFPSAQAASCALFADTDSDGDLDLALIDESADEVTIMRNSGTTRPVPIPTVSAWGVLAIALFLLVAGSVRLRYRHP